MKSVINAVYFIISLFLCFSCKDSNKNEEVISNNLKTEISYSKNSSDKELLSQNDTITANLGDTINFSISTNGVNMGLFGDNNIDIQESGDGEYMCIIKSAGTATIGNFTYSEDSSNDLLINFFIKVPTKKYNYVVIKDPTYTVNIGNETLKSTIEKELKDAFPLKLFDRYKLECNALQGGNLVYISTSKDTISGTFTSSNVLKMNDVAISYNGTVYNFTLEKDTDSQLAYGYYLKLDLTEKFRTKYPSETINEVSVSALTLKNFY